MRLQYRNGSFQNTEDGISSAAFCTWMRRDPQTLVWWSTLYRLTCASHGVQCCGCNTVAPTGLLYVCRHCTDYVLCQLCFFTGRCCAPHSPDHAVQEHCNQVKPCDRSTAATLRKPPPSPALAQRFLPLSWYRACAGTVPVKVLTIRAGDTAKATCAAGDSPRRQLASVITQLQGGYSALCNTCLPDGSNAALLQQHTRGLALHITALRSVLQVLKGHALCPLGARPIFSWGTPLCPLAGCLLSSGRVPSVLWQGAFCPLAGRLLSSGRAPSVLWQGAFCPLAGRLLSSGRAPSVLWQGAFCPLAGRLLSSGSTSSPHSARPLSSGDMASAL
ncbi:EF-hand domain type 2 [Trinorchestia longiramus]|nr:EF-hand domain type 2 [Trinorchestia longiramus]